jgi:exosortase C (VPDSG-CTERM-specific)
MNHPVSPSSAGGDTTVRSRGENGPGAAAPVRGQAIRFGLFVLGLSICFAYPLAKLAEYSLHSEFFSYILLIPVISVYLVWTKRPELPAQAAGSWKAAALPGLAGLALGGACEWARHTGWTPMVEDYLTLMITAYLLIVAAGCLAFFGPKFSRLIAFPVLFLIFMIPMPSAMLASTTLFFQKASALVASWMLDACGTPFLLMGLTLSLPGVPVIYIAPECSGIHSTMVLLITAFLAGHLFLNSWWKRAVLIAIVIPLAMLRNGFRIFVISELCVHVGPQMIDSPIHHKGGPIFFLLSLIPFFIILFWLRKSEPRAAATTPAGAKV